MKRLVLILLFMFYYLSVYSQNDSVWVSNRHCSTENITVSPDERFVVAWGKDGWWVPDPSWDSDTLDPQNAHSDYGNPAKVFNAQTGEWIKTFYDSNCVNPRYNHVESVTFSPDSSIMILGSSDTPTLVVDLNNNLEVIDTIHARFGRPVYSDDGSIIAVNNKSFYDANTYTKLMSFGIPDTVRPTDVLSYIESDGTFRKNGREYIFSFKCEYGPNPLKPLKFSAWVVIDLEDSTLIVLRYMPFTNFYHRYGCGYYGYDLSWDPSIENKYEIRDYITDSLVMEMNNKSLDLQFSKDGNYLFAAAKWYDIPNTTAVCQDMSDFLSWPVTLGNQYLYGSTGNGRKIAAERPCIATGIPPIVKGSENSYPMPSRDFMNIDIELEPDNYSAEILDLSGKKIEEIKMGQKSGLEKIEINTLNLIPGTYFLLLKNSKQTKTYKFVKE